MAKRVDHDEVAKFHISVILSVVTGRQVFAKNYGMGHITELLNFMMNRNVLLFANTGKDDEIMRQCKEYIIGQHIQHELHKVNAKNVNHGNVVQWLNEQIKKFGEFLPVRRFVNLS